MPVFIKGTRMNVDTVLEEVTFLDGILGEGDPLIPYHHAEPCINLDHTTRMIRIMQRGSRAMFTFTNTGTALNPIPVYTFNAGHSENFNIWDIKQQSTGMMTVYCGNPCNQEKDTANIPNGYGAWHFSHISPVAGAAPPESFGSYRPAEGYPLGEYTVYAADGGLLLFEHGQQLQADDYFWRHQRCGKSQVWIKMEVLWNGQFSPGNARPPTIVSVEPSGLWGADPKFSLVWRPAHEVWDITYTDNMHPDNPEIPTSNDVWPWWLPALKVTAGGGYKYLAPHGPGYSDFEDDGRFRYPFSLHNTDECSTSHPGASIIPAAGSRCIITLLYFKYPPS